MSDDKIAFLGPFGSCAICLRAEKGPADSDEGPEKENFAKMLGRLDDLMK